MTDLRSTVPRSQTYGKLLLPDKTQPKATRLQRVELLKKLIIQRGWNNTLKWPWDVRFAPTKPKQTLRGCEYGSNAGLRHLQ